MVTEQQMHKPGPARAEPVGNTTTPSFRAPPEVGGPLALALSNVSHAFGRNTVVRNVDLAIAPGEIVALVGPSGCGKSTLLRLVAGLMDLQQGRISIGGQETARPGHEVPPERRRVGLVFQDYALFPHLSVAENVAFGLTDLGAGGKRARVEETLRQVGMDDYAAAFPHTLSGGQQQRVALARALAPQPRILLLDEPFSGLDSVLRNQVRDETLHVLKRLGAATLIVTHDPEEAMFLADRIALMRDGRIEQSGTPFDLYCRPVSPYAARFFGDVNRIPGVVRVGRVETPIGAVNAAHLPDGTAVDVLIRPEAFTLAPARGGDEIVARVDAARMLGRTSLIHLTLTTPDGGSLHLHARVRGPYLPPEQSAMSIGMDPNQAFVFDVGESSAYDPDQPA